MVHHSKKAAYVTHILELAMFRINSVFFGLDLIRSQLTIYLAHLTSFFNIFSKN